MKPFIFILVLSTLILNVFTLSAQECKIFWVSQDQYSGKIQSSSLSGTHVTDVITGLQLPSCVAVDCTVTPNKLYYSETGANRIMRVNFDGTNPEEVVTGVSSVREIELDLVNRKIYWGKDSYSDDRIQRADMDSLNSNVEDVWTNSYAMHRLGGIGLDPDNHWIFWTQSRSSLVDVIKRKNYGSVGDTIIGSFLSPKDIDVVGDSIYWIWQGANCLMRGTKNGSVADTVLENFNALYFEVDTITHKVFWADHTYHKISSCNLDGSGKTDLVTGVYSPMGIALYVNPLTTSIDEKQEVVKKYKLSQNYPNPFNPKTNIQFRIPNAGFVTLKIFNVLGQEIEHLVAKHLQSGTHIFQWNAEHYAGGVYFYQMIVGAESNPDFSQTKKLILLK